tara:strand:- start:231 stop:860 length:630 start_codon:yes stop_codon:yes gene_type:complete
MAYLGRQPIVGNYSVLDPLTASATATYPLTKGSVPVVPYTPANCIVSLNGVIQAPFDSYTVSGSNIVFATALTGTDSIDFITVLGDNLSIGVPTDNTVSASKLSYAEATLTDGANIAWNAQSSPISKVTLGGNRILNAPSNSVAGQFISLLIIQDATGTRTLTWNAVFEFTADTAPTLTATANYGDVFTFRYNGSKWLEVGRNLNLILS